MHFLQFITAQGMMQFVSLTKTSQLTCKQTKFRAQKQYLGCMTKTNHKNKEIAGSEECSPKAYCL